MFSEFFWDFIPFLYLFTLPEVFLTFFLLFSSFGLVACFQRCIVMIESTFLRHFWDFCTVLRLLYSTKTFVQYWDFCTVLRLLSSTQNSVHFWDFCTVLRVLLYREHATNGRWPCLKLLHKKQRYLTMNLLPYLLLRSYQLRNSIPAKPIVRTLFYWHFKVSHGHR